jgi:cyclophilin family peptidyl-prolyl cis-trans isomerase
VFKFAALALAGLFAAPLLAQQTGPDGMAEPQYKGHPEVAVAPVPPVTPDNTLNLQLSSGGIVSIQLRPDKAPLSVARIKTLTDRHFYDGLTFHRVIDGFMAQGGDPKGDGSGGSDLPNLKAEFNDLPHVRGAMAMARAQDDNSANSQFYIMLSPNLTLDGKYTVIGRVIAGMGYVDQLEKGEPPANPSRIIHAYIGAKPSNPATPPVSALPAGTQAVLPGARTTPPMQPLAATPH